MNKMDGESKKSVIKLIELLSIKPLTFKYEIFCWFEPVNLFPYKHLFLKPSNYYKKFTLCHLEIDSITTACCI